MAPRYTDKVAQYFWRPVRPAGTELRGLAGSMQCGTLIAFTADISAGRLHNLGFRAFACPHIIAACNWCADYLEGRPAEALSQISLDDLRSELDIPVEKAGKLLILQDALLACYADYRA
jgi:NifU-like protein involved in Fe-S cluster formation